VTPAAIIQRAAADGVRLSLSASGTIKASGDQAAVNRWLPTIREHKSELLLALGGTSWGWRVVYPEDHPGAHIGGRVFECYIIPLQTLAEVQALHAGAKIDPIAEAAG
jgi:hypothetical protein